MTLKTLAILGAAAVCLRGQDIVIGASADFSGPARGPVIEAARGAQAYFESVNAGGGVGGKRIKFVAYDDGGDPARAIRNTRQLIDRDDALALFGYGGTATVTRVLPVLRLYRGLSVRLFFPLTGADPPRRPPYDDYVYHLRASTREETRDLVDRFTAIGRGRIAVFYQNDAHGRSGWDGVRAALSLKSTNMAADAAYRHGAAATESFTEQVQVLKSANPDAVITIGEYGATAGFIRDARDAGWNVPIAATSSAGSEHLVQAVFEQGKAKGKDYSANLVFCQVMPTPDDASIPAAGEYKEALARFHPPPPAPARNYTALGPTHAGLEGYLNAKLLVEALKRVEGSLSRAFLREAIENRDSFDIGLAAPVSIGAERHESPPLYYTTVEGGKETPVTDWSRWKK